MSTLRELRRSPLRSVATVMALALSVAALGVLAVPGLSSATLQELAAKDEMADITIHVTPLPADAPDLGELGGVNAVETRHAGSVQLPDNSAVSTVGFDPAAQRVNIVSATEGRLPAGPGEALVTPALVDAGIALGDRLDAPGGPVSVVGVGTTAAWESEPMVALDHSPPEVVHQGANRLLVRAEDTSAEGLEAVVAEVRAALEPVGVTFTGFPDLNVDGAHPLEAEISMVSVMIGMLGAVSALVALVLLASTTAAIIADRSCEVAVLRAIGSGPRATRRRLRHIALVTAALAAAIGIPLGTVVANVMSRMVLERFADVTPALSVSVPLVAVSLAFLLLGARLVSAPAARRLVSQPLAGALRDRDGRPWGNRWYQRSASRLAGWLRVPTTWRVAGGNMLARPGRTTGLVLQAASAVSAVLIVASLGTSLAQFADAELEPWRWDTATHARDPGAGWAAGPTDQPATIEGSVREETGLFVDGSLDGLEVDVWGFGPDTAAIDTDVRSGRWFEAVADGEVVQAVVTDGFARHRGIALGDEVIVDLPSGPATVEVVGTHRLRAAAVMVNRADLGWLLGRPGQANVVWSTDPGAEPGPLAAAAAAGTVVDVSRPIDLVEEDRAARDMIMGMFWAIGIVVAAVAGIGFGSSLQMLLHDRRRELAAVRATGASRWGLTSMLMSEVLPIAVAGAAIGAVAAHFGAAALMGSVESAESVEIGYSYASSAVAPTVIGALTVTAVLVVLAVRPAVRLAPALLLRAAD